MSYKLYHGDCLEVMKGLPDNSIDSVVTDPPYGLAFMNRHWDYELPSIEIWREALRVLKPGGYLLSFGGSRTYHRMACSIEDAGFEIRDQIMWVYGSGFPKSLDVSKAIDKTLGAERESTGRSEVSGKNCLMGGLSGNSGELGHDQFDEPVTAAAAAAWQGFGTALKPAHEPIVMARKPLSEKTVAANVLLHGTGAINIDGCRIETVDNLNGGGYSENFQGSSFLKYGGKLEYKQPEGRWPANLIHDGSDEVVKLFPSSKGQQGDVKGTEPSKTGDENTNCYGEYGRIPTAKRNDDGSAARFFYCAKASRKDRNAGCGHITETQYSHDGRETPIDNAYQRNSSSSSSNGHPTVKPTDLMRYLCRLLTPPDGTILDPFMGSGSTGRGAMLEGFKFIGIEREEEYLVIAKARILDAQVEAFDDILPF